MSPTLASKRTLAAFWSLWRRTCRHSGDLRAEASGIVCAELNCLKPVVSR